MEKLEGKDNVGEHYIVTKITENTAVSFFFSCPVDPSTSIIYRSDNNWWFKINIAKINLDSAFLHCKMMICLDNREKCNPVLCNPT